MMKRSIPSKIAFAACSTMGVILLATAHAQEKRPENSPNNSPKRERRSDGVSENRHRGGDLKMGIRSIKFPGEFRTITGLGNNKANPEWGAADIPLLRKTTIDYADGVGFPSGGKRPGAREISNAVAAQTESILNRHLASDYLWQWGQFLDHDITLTPVGELAEPFNIKVPAGDPFFDPKSTGTVEIGMERSYGEQINGIREQFNDITAFVDASNVYGSDEDRAKALRTLDGTGRLKTSTGNLLPFNTEGLRNAPSAQAPHFFLAGDFRANEQVGLTSLHTLFVREHNYWAVGIKKANPALSENEIYEAARVIVGAEMQVITYREFLPFLLGPGAIPPYRGYRADLDPGISNVFATASYRFGHTMLSPQLLRLDSRLKVIKEGNLDLAKAFFSPSKIIDEGGIDPILRGLARQPAQELDTMLVDGVRNFLFGQPGAGGFDLASLNIQRGRDHGLPGFNEVRRNFGLEPIKTFKEINPDPSVGGRLAGVYSSVEDIDPWVGGLAEPPFRGGIVGETVFTIILDQFLRLRDGDRFWYQNHLDRELQQLVEKQTLAEIIHRNTAIARELPDNLWKVNALPGAGKGPEPLRPHGGGPGKGKR
jgi:peroxidase